MKTVIAAILLAVFSTAASAGENKNVWTTTDTALQATMIALSAIDWLQTRTIAKNPQSFNETNPILGKHPDVTKVDLYFAASAAAHTAVSYLLPQPYRKYWQYISIAVETGYVANNFTLGIKMDL